MGGGRGCLGIGGEVRKVCGVFGRDKSVGKEGGGG